VATRAAAHPEQIARWEDGTVDIGLCWSVLVDPSFRRPTSPRSRIVAVLREDDPLAARSGVRFPALRTRPLLVTPQDNPYIDSLLHALEAGVPQSHASISSRLRRVASTSRSGAASGIHPGTIAAVNRIGAVVFRPLVDPADRDHRR